MRDKGLCAVMGVNYVGPTSPPQQGVGEVPPSEEVRQEAMGCMELEALYLRGCFWVSQVGLSQALAKTTSLTSLCIGGCPHHHDDLLATVPSCLASLSLRYCTGK